MKTPLVILGKIEMTQSRTLQASLSRVMDISNVYANPQLTALQRLMPRKQVDETAGESFC